MNPAGNTSQGEANGEQALRSSFSFYIPHLTGAVKFKGNEAFENTQKIVKIFGTSLKGIN